MPHDSNPPTDYNLAHAADRGVLSYSISALSRGWKAAVLLIVSDCKEFRLAGQIVQKRLAVRKLRPIHVCVIVQTLVLLNHPQNSQVMPAAVKAVGTDTCI